MKFTFLLSLLMSAASAWVLHNGLIYPDDDQELKDNPPPKTGASMFMSF